MDARETKLAIGLFLAPPGTISRELSDAVTNVQRAVHETKNLNIGMKAVYCGQNPLMFGLAAHTTRDWALNGKPTHTLDSLSEWYAAAVDDLETLITQEVDRERANASAAASPCYD